LGIGRSLNEKSNNKGWLFPSILAVILWGIWGGLSGKAVAIAGPFNVALIFGIWLLARLLPYFDAVPLVVIAIVDSVFMFWVALLILKQ
jgi:hypothetical protein